MDLEQEIAIREAVARGLAKDRVLLNARRARCELTDDFVARAVEHTWPDFAEQANAAIVAHLRTLKSAGYVIVPVSDYRELLMFRASKE